MPFRFRRSIRIAPGIRLNVGKRGLSASVGVRGAHITVVGGPGVRATVSAPGTGLSYTTGTGRRRSPQPGSWGKWLGSAAITLALLWWFGWL